ncbi:MAG: M48 family metallopeptidase [Bacillota bacterium]
MWELIQANKRKTIILFIALGSCLLGLGYAVGFYFSRSTTGGSIGIGLALLIWIFMSAKSYFYGDSLILSASKSKPLSRNMHPQLFNIVEEMTIASNLTQQPSLYAIPSLTPNAFAVGIKEDESAIVVTTGLLSKLDRHELQGVIAHEMSHIINRDVLYMTFAQTLLSTILLITSFNSSKSSSRRHRNRSWRSSKKSSEGAMLLLVALLTSGIARMIYFSLSRKREYLADATAVRLTRYPQGLASALEKIAADKGQLVVANKMTAPLYISNPLKKFSSKTHPPLKERIRILRKISDGANYRHYQRAYNLVKDNASNIIPDKALSGSDFLSLQDRTTSSDKSAVAANDSATKERETQNWNRALDDFGFLLCDCGLKVKIPASFAKEKIACPRCGRVHKVADASDSPQEVSPYKESPFNNNPDGTEIKKVTKSNSKQAEGTEGTDSDVEHLGGELTYLRENPGTWDSFLCDCGHLVQLSPVFKAPKITCKGCGSEIKIIDQ